MATKPGTLEQIAIWLGRALVRLTARLADDELQETLTRLGLVVPPELLAQPAVVTARNALVTSASALPATIDQLTAAADTDDLVGVLQHGAALLTEANALITAFDTLPTAIDAVRSGFPEVGDGPFGDFAAGFARKLLDLLITDSLDELPALGAALALAGLLERVRPFEATDFDRIDVERTVIHYERIARLFGAPADHFKEVYDWGTPEFDGLKLLPAISDFLAQIGVPTAFHPPSESSDTLLEAYVLDIRPNGTLDPPGLDASVVSPFGGTIDAAVPVSDPAWSGTFSARGVFGTVLTATVRPPLTVGVAAPAATFEGRADVRVLGEGPQPFVILGTAGGNRLEVKTVTFAAGMTFSTEFAAGAEPFVEGALQGGRILVDGSEGDGFISTVLSGVEIDANFDVGLTWSLLTGVRFHGSATLAIMLPVHVDLGPFAVHEVFLVAALDGETIPVEVSTSLSCSLGPIDAAIGGIGFTTTIAFPGTGGNAGPAQVDLAFKPPTAVGLALDAHGVKGGGFVDVDRPNNRYVGMLQLQFQDTIDITAIAVIDTSLPDAFSLLILISAEFQPVQLGLGFTLNGIGGLLALHRTMDVERIRAGLRSNSLDSVLFPADPIANASRIASEITAIFPLFEDHFIIGPMAKIGYGTPTLITVELGLLIELPDPLRIAIVGVLKALLPEERAALLDLRVNFLGVIDFDKGELSFDASIFDSRLLSYDLSGDMAVRMRWLGTPVFLLSVGGFHPAFQPPPLNLPQLRRLAVQLLDSNKAQLRLETYFAVTSNTVQFGARVELRAEAGSFNAYGFIAFDVLFQFSPFHFIAEVKAMVALRVKSRTIASISLALTLEGPTPWKAKGTASLKLFWFLTVKVRFSTTWGEQRANVIPDVAVLPQLVAALKNRANWKSELPSQRHLLVSLRADTSGVDTIRVHPLGGLSISQKVVPLNLPIAKFGNSTPSDHREFAISDVRASGDLVAAIDLAPVHESFAPAQFFEKSDAERLSAESFVQFPAGVALGVSQELESSHYVRREVDYELKYRDSQRDRALPPVRSVFQVDGVAFNAWARNGAVARSPLSFAATGKSAIAPGAVVLQQERFAVTHIGDLTLALAGGDAANEAEAFALLTRLVAARPELAGRLQVVPSYEVNRGRVA